MRPVYQVHHPAGQRKHYTSAQEGRPAAPHIKMLVIGLANSSHLVVMKFIMVAADGINDNRTVGGKGPLCNKLLQVEGIFFYLINKAFVVRPIGMGKTDIGTGIIAGNGFILFLEQEEIAGLRHGK